MLLIYIPPHKFTQPKASNKKRAHINKLLRIALIA